jgi:hypothetical protein
VIFWSYAFPASFLKIVGKPNEPDVFGYSSITNDNNILLCRAIFPYCLKLNRNGDILWKKEITGLTLAIGGIGQLKNNYFVVEGQALELKGQHILSILDDTTLTSKWINIFPELTSEGEGVDVIDVINDNYLLMITKKRENTEDTFDILISEINSSGNLIWVKKILMPDDFYPFGSVHKTSDGNYIISGGLNYSSFFSLIKINKNGDILFSKKYTGDGTIIVDYPEGLTELADGSYILVGTASLPSGKAGILLLKVDPNGNLIKAKLLLSNGDLDSTGVSADLTGFIVACRVDINGYGYPCLIKMTNNLELQWSKIYSNLPGEFTTVDYIPNEGYVAAGNVVVYGNIPQYKLLLAKTDLNGLIDNCSSISDINLQVMDVTSNIKTEEMNLSVINSSLRVERYSGTISLSKDVDLDTTDVCYANSPTPPTPSSPFTDVPPDYWAFNYIKAVKDAGITKGCNPPQNDKYCPEDVVTRAQMAAFIIRAIEGEPTSYNANPYFADVSPTHWAFKYVQRVKERGIAQGYSGTNLYGPEDNVTREQMAKMLIMGLVSQGKISEPPSDYCASGSPFSDVDSSSWSCRYIKRLKELGITQGCNPPANDRYCPQDLVTRAQMSAFIYRGFLSNSSNSSVGAMMLSSGPFGAIMVGKGGEVLLPIVERDTSGNPVKVTGALYMNGEIGNNLLVYFDNDGRPAKAFMGDFIILYSN